MKRRLSTLMVFAAALFVAAHNAWSWSNATCCQRLVTLFESHVHPDLPLDKFAAGQIGIIEPTWFESYLLVTYRYLNGPGLDASEQKAMLSFWNDRLGLPTPESIENANTTIAPGMPINDISLAVSKWLDARGKVPGLGPIEGIGVYRNAQGEMFSFVNCTAGSFRTAATTLDAMIAKFGLASAPVKQWVNAQDEVFDNCSDDPPEYGATYGAWSAMVEEWTTARNKVAGPDPSSGKFSINCPGMMFRTAALTLRAMIEKQGASNPAVKQWLEDEDKALDACSSRTARGTGPTPPEIPAPLTDGTPFDIAQRNYQIAAATFYSGDYDGAAKLFDAIGSDSSSPWRQLAPFLVARAMTRKATLSGANDNVLLAQVETRLQKIIADASDETVNRYAQQVLGYVEAQLHPGQREAELAHALTLSTPGDVLRQNIIDYFWIIDHRTANGAPLTDDLTMWLSGMRAKIDAPDSDRAIEKWKKTSSLAWTVAAITWLEPSDPDAPALIDAARKLKPDSPAYVTVNYHLARLQIEQGKLDEGRATLDALLAMHDRLPISTVNQIKRMQRRTARNLAELLAYLPRTPLGFTDTGDFDEIPSSLLETPTPTETPTPEPTPVALIQDNRMEGRWGEGSNGPGVSGRSGIVVRGGAFYIPNVPAAATPAPTPDPLDELAKEQLFDDDGAAVLTRGLPLTLMVEASHSKTLPASLRSQVALVTFVRAILLNDDAAARNVAPIVIAANPKLLPMIERWSAAKTADERNFAAAYMMLANPGMSYDLETGAGRVSAIDELDSFRDNWWPSYGEPESPILPDFLSKSETKSAVDEWQKVSAINGPSLFCSAAIDHARTEPDDPRSPEALYRCLTAVHLGCSNDRGTDLAKSAFELLHRRYPDSVWATRGHVWYRGGGCGGT